jgi:hypothetical protein
MYSIKSISKRPLIRLSLAIAAGLVLAHMAIRSSALIFQKLEDSPRQRVTFDLSTVKPIPGVVDPYAVKASDAANAEKERQFQKLIHRR